MSAILIPTTINCKPSLIRNLVRNEELQSDNTMYKKALNLNFREVKNAFKGLKINQGHGIYGL